MGLLNIFKNSSDKDIHQVFKRLSVAEKQVFNNSYTLFEETILDIIDIFADNLFFLDHYRSVFEITYAYIYVLKECVLKDKLKYVVVRELSEKYTLFHSDTISKQFTAYCLIKASHTDFRLNQANGRGSLNLMIKEIEASAIRKVQNMLWRIVDEQNGSGKEYLEYLIANNPQNIPKEELKSFVGIMVYNSRHSKKETIEIFSVYIEELIDAFPGKSSKNVTTLIDMCSYFCGLLHINNILSENEMNQIAEEYTRKIITKNRT